MNDRTPISEGGYYAHRNCGTGDRIRATDADGNHYEGTVQQCRGAVVYVKTDSGEMLEFRRASDPPDNFKGIQLTLEEEEGTDVTSQKQSETRYITEFENESRESPTEGSG